VEPAAERAVANFERKTDYRSPETSIHRRARLRELERAEKVQDKKTAAELAREKKGSK